MAMTPSGRKHGLERFEALQRFRQMEQHPCGNDEVVGLAQLRHLGEIHLVQAEVGEVVLVLQVLLVCEAGFREIHVRDRGIW